MSSCAGDRPAADPSQGLRIGFGIGPTARASGVKVLTDMLYAEPLVFHDWHGRPLPGLAVSWQWTDGHRTLRLQLKPGVRYHDGSPLTASAVVQFLEKRNIRQTLGFRYVTELTAEDPGTITIRLSQPDAFLLPQLSDLRIAHPDAADVATGPFRLQQRAPVVQAVRFDEYHGGTPSLGGVRIVTYDTQRSAWAALLRREVDVVQEVNRAAVKFMEGSANVRTYSSVQPFYIYLAFNERHPAMRNVEVRRALSEALNRQEIIDRVMQRRGIVAEGPVWPFHWAYAPLPSPYGHNPESAKRRLESAGFPLRATNATAARTRFTFKCLVWNEEPQFERIALLVQRQLFDVGVNLEIELLPFDQLVRRAESGDFDTYLMQTNAGRQLDFTYRFWRSDSPANTALQRSGYTGADAALDRVRHSTTEEEMRAAVRDLATRFHADAPAVFIAWTEMTRAVDATFAVAESPLRDPFANIWQWHPRKDEQ